MLLCACCSPCSRALARAEGAARRAENTGTSRRARVDRPIDLFEILSLHMPMRHMSVRHMFDGLTSKHQVSMHTKLAVTGSCYYFLLIAQSL